MKPLPAFQLVISYQEDIEIVLCIYLIDRWNNITIFVAKQGFYAVEE